MFLQARNRERLGNASYSQVSSAPRANPISLCERRELCAAARHSSRRQRGKESRAPGAFPSISEYTVTRPQTHALPGSRVFPYTSPLNTTKEQGQVLRRYHPSWEVTPNAQAGTGRAGQGPHKSLNFNILSTDALGQGLVLPLPPELGLCSQLLEGFCIKFILKKKIPT